MCNRRVDILGRRSVDERITTNSIIGKCFQVTHSSMKCMVNSYCSTTSENWNAVSAFEIFWLPLLSSKRRLGLKKKFFEGHLSTWNRCDAARAPINNFMPVLKNESMTMGGYWFFFRESLIYIRQVTVIQIWDPYIRTGPTIPSTQHHETMSQVWHSSNNLQWNASNTSMIWLRLCINRQRTDADAPLTGVKTSI